MNLQHPGRGENEDRYQALFESPDCVYVHDLEGRFLDANLASLKLIGYRRDELPTLDLSDLLADDELTFAEVETNVSAVSRDGRPYAVLGFARAADLAGKNGLDIMPLSFESRQRAETHVLSGSSEPYELELLFTDVVLPGVLQGDELARRILQERPELKVLFMSGYPRDAVLRSGRLDEGINYLDKPFTAGALAAKLREVLC